VEAVEQRSASRNQDWQRFVQRANRALRVADPGAAGIAGQRCGGRRPDLDQLAELGAGHVRDEHQVRAAGELPGEQQRRQRQRERASAGTQCAGAAEHRS
jgi:hypothetical protein